MSTIDVNNDVTNNAGIVHVEDVHIEDDQDADYEP